MQKIESSLNTVATRCVLLLLLVCIVGFTFYGNLSVIRSSVIIFIQYPGNDQYGLHGWSDGHE